MRRPRADLEPLVHRLRPPCPRCQRKTWPGRGLDEQQIYRCLRHGDWVMDVLEDHLGDPLPFFRWRRYDWRHL